MAKRKAPPEIPASVQEVNDILDAVGAGKDVGPAQLHLAAIAAAGVRAGWIRGLHEAMGFLRPDTPEYEAFKNCTQSMLELFAQHGFVSTKEMQEIWWTVETRGRIR